MSDQNLKRTVSFIIPCFRSEDTIKECLEHIKNLEFKEGKKEIILVDNGSDDKTVEIAKPLVDKLLLEPDAGLGELRNKGAAASTSEALVFLDSDCLLQKEWLNIAWPHLEKPEVGLVGSKTHILPEGSTWVAEAWKIHLDYSGKLSSPGWLATRAIATRKHIFEEIGGFSEEVETCEDVELGHKISKNYQVIVENSLAPLHLKDADTLPDFFKKEVWRGIDSVKTSWSYLRNQKFRFRELLSFILPFYFLFFAAVALLSFLLILVGSGKAACYFITSLTFILLPVIFLSLKTVLSEGKLKSFFQLFLVYSTYIAARSFALVKAFI